MWKRFLRRPLRAWLLMLLVATVVAGAHGRAAMAQTDGLGGSFITPFPENDTYRLLVVGDWVAGGMVEGLVEGFSNDPRVQITRKHQAVPTLFRGELDDDLKALDQGLSKDKAHIAVVMMSTGDRVSLRLPNLPRRAQVGSEEWKAEYGLRIDRIMRLLKNRQAAVYWVGLPVLRRADANEDAQMMNEIIRSRALLNGVRFVDVYQGFAEDGEFAAYGPDLTGKNRRLRDSDGIGFTGTGYRKLAHFVETEIKRDLVQARAERSIPLAGGEPEQAKVNPEKAKAAALAAAAAAAKTKRPTGPVTGLAALLPGAAPTGPIGGASQDQKADNGKITLKTAGASGREETITLDILRPSLPAAILSIVSRRQDGDKSGPIGEQLMTPLPGGLALLSTITSASDSAGVRRRLSPTQAPFFRVLVKGEPQAPKPGRADDFLWPREAYVPPAAAKPVVQTTGSVPLPVRAGRPALERTGRP